MEWESTITLELNTAKSTDYIEKCLKKKLSKIKFSTKQLSGHIFLSLPIVELGVSKDSLFAFQCIIFKKWQMFGPLSPHLGDIEICCYWVFCRKLNFGQLLFEVFFDIIGAFGSVLCQSEPTFPYSPLYFKRMANVWLLLAPLLGGGGIGLCVHSFFFKKFNFRQLLFEVLFFDRIETVGSVQPLTYFLILVHYNIYFRSGKCLAILAQLLG